MTLTFSKTLNYICFASTIWVNGYLWGQNCCLWLILFDVLYTWKCCIFPRELKWLTEWNKWQGYSYSDTMNVTVWWAWAFHEPTITIIIALTGLIPNSCFIPGCGKRYPVPWLVSNWFRLILIGQFYVFFLQATNLGMSEKMSALAVNGPTTSHGLPVFKWTKEFNVSRIGLPESYNFDVVLMKPSL